MHFAPPTCTQLDHVASSLTAPNLNARVCCLFVNGSFGVWELDSRNELRAVSVNNVPDVAACASLHVHGACTTSLFALQTGSA